MIASIFGKITFVGKRKIIIENNRVSYWFSVKENHNFEKDLEKPRQVFCRIIKKITANMLVEEAFAFETLEEKEWFSKFIEINGVGSKTALNLLNNDLDAIKEHIKSNNYHALCKLNGSNSRIARSLLTLVFYDKDHEWDNSLSKNKADKLANDYEELFDTLKSLGYKQNEIQGALTQIEIKPNFDVSQIVAEAIKLISFNNNEIANKPA